MNTHITAHCGCGAVHFQSQSCPVLQLFCHCRDCQESTGRPFATTAFFTAEHTEVFGPLAVRKFTAQSGNTTSRESCATCGSVMFDRSEGFPTLIGVMAERIAMPFQFTPVCHAWTKSRQSWVTIPDAARQYPENVTPGRITEEKNR